MKKFVFSMEKVLDYSTHLQKSEKEILAGMRHEHDHLCEKRDGLKAARCGLRDEYSEKSSKGMTVKEIEAILTYMEELQTRITAQEKVIDALNAQIERQIKKVLKANKEKRSMEILRDRQLVLYEAATRKENERVIDEFVISRGTPA